MTSRCACGHTGAAHDHDGAGPCLPLFCECRVFTHAYWHDDPPTIDPDLREEPQP